MEVPDLSCKKETDSELLTVNEPSEEIIEIRPNETDCVKTEKIDCSEYKKRKNIFMPILPKELKVCKTEFTNKCESRIIEQNQHNIEIRPSENNRDKTSQICSNNASEQKMPVKKEIKCKLVNILNLRGYPKFFIEIDGKIYSYGIRAIKSNYRIELRCTKQFLSSACNNISFIQPLDSLLDIIHDKPKKIRTNSPKFIDRSDPRVYDIKYYDADSFDFGRGHRCPGTELDVYLQKNKPEIPVISLDEMENDIDKKNSLVSTNSKNKNILKQ